ncbi:ferredoxin [Sinomonas atrocyanea]|uniref:Ferredoxin n=1 Tax=Sinomonas atrocyanea TaxID=37927 RepID=A0A126ZZA3_9MICC|nr:ferredoxin [Sinomonas atrocyanea]
MNLALAGAVAADPWDAFSLENAAGESGPPPLQVSLWSDPEHGAYVKMATRAGVLVGFVALGMPRAAAELTLLFESGAELPADRSVILRLDGPEAALAGGPSAAGTGPEATLCRCAGVSRGEVQEAVGNGCSTVEDISRKTRAGTGCGGCRDGLRELIEAHFAAAAA